jgi:4-hydroxy-tetrahydrodipicolinate synthase
MTFSGSMVALVTPFKNGKIDEDALQKLIEFQIAGGTSVLVPCGTTGESATLTHDEHDRVIALTIKIANKRAKVLAGAGSNSTAEAIRLHQYCKKIGADGALHITPYYNKPTQDGLFQHFQAIAKASDLPVVLYNVPGRTGVNLLPDTVIKLAQIDTIIGIKEASGNLDQASEIINRAPDGFALYSGEDSLTYPLYCLGAQGVISVTTNLVPKDMSEQYRALASGDFATARKIHYKLLDLHKTLFIETNPIPVKTALALMGMVEEEFRLPLCAIAPANREKLKSVLKPLGLIF